MIYTVGNPVTYEPLFKENSVVRKKGRTNDYSGGIAFKTVQDAKKWLREHPNLKYRVYALESDWSNTYWSEAEGFNCIIEPCVIRKIS